MRWSVTVESKLVNDWKTVPKGIAFEPMASDNTIPKPTPPSSTITPTVRLVRVTCATRPPGICGRSGSSFSGIASSGRASVA